MSEEKFSLKWNDFGSNASRSFGLFRNESYLHDVTLVSEDFKHIPAHKLVLSACSEYFKNILQETKQSQPLLCLDGVNSADLQNVLDYVYEGEVRIFQENLDRFLEVAQKLKLDGLLSNDDNDDPEERQSTEIEENATLPYKHEQGQFKNKEKPIKIPIQPRDDGTVALTVTGNFNLEEHKERLNEQIVDNDDRSVTCKVCGKTSKPNQKHMSIARSNMRNHVEIHFEGLSYPCPSCDKTFRSARNLHTHCKSH